MPKFLTELVGILVAAIVTAIIMSFVGFNMAKTAFNEGVAIGRKDSLEVLDYCIERARTKDRLASQLIICIDEMKAGAYIKRNPNG